MKKFKKKTYFWILVILIFISLQLNAQNTQTYLQIRIGYSTGRYAPFNKEELDRDEHDFKYGTLIDVEVGKKYLYKNYSLTFGTRIQYSLRALKGIYTASRWVPEADINAHIFAVYITPGISKKISNKFDISLQSNIGISYIKWYQDGVLKDSFKVFYLPIDTSLEYKLKNTLISKNIKQNEN